MQHVLTYQIDGIEHDTGRQYRTITQVGILKPDEGVALVNAWSRLSRSSIQYTFLHVKPATPDQQIQINAAIQFSDNTVYRSGVIKEIVTTSGAIKVLEMLDSDEDAPSYYPEIIALVAKQMSITIQQLEAELAPFV